jgi:hypothetical protein
MRRNFIVILLRAVFEGCLILDFLTQQVTGRNERDDTVAGVAGRADGFETA